jgi:hypothetical protein
MGMEWTQDAWLFCTIAPLSILVVVGLKQVSSFVGHFFSCSFMHFSQCDDDGFWWKRCSDISPPSPTTSHWWKFWTSTARPFSARTFHQASNPTTTIHRKNFLGVLAAGEALDCQMSAVEFLLDGSSSPVEQSTPSGASFVFFHSISSTPSAADFPLLK